VGERTFAWLHGFRYLRTAGKTTGRRALFVVALAGDSIVEWAQAAESVVELR
jgi:hypothetical protein